MVVSHRLCPQAVMSLFYTTTKLIVGILSRIVRTILTDVYTGSTAASHLSALLLTSRSNRNAQAACGSLHESLLSADSTGFTTDISSLLQYEVFQGHFPVGQLFWISSSNRLCRAINPSGRIQTVSCGLSLPVLCSQSAPVEAAPAAANEITVKSNGLTLTG